MAGHGFIKLMPFFYVTQYQDDFIFEKVQTPMKKKDVKIEAMWRLALLS